MVRISLSVSLSLSLSVSVSLRAAAALSGSGTPVSRSQGKEEVGEKTTNIVGISWRIGSERTVLEFEEENTREIGSEARARDGTTSR